MIDNEVAEHSVSEKTGNGRKVVHWARCWRGKFLTEPTNRRYIWEEEPGEIEVSVQTYGEPRWIETLYTDIISTCRELLELAGPEYDSIRLRVNLYSHQPDGRNAKFTLEHVERR